MTLTTREAGAAFADVICADPQWLDAEFDALISASFSEPPAPPPPAPPRVPPQPRHPAAALPAARARPGRRSPPRPRRPGPRPAALTPGASPRPATGPPPPPPDRAAARTTAISTGHRPGGLGKENRQGTIESNLMASDTRRGSPAGSPAVLVPGPACYRLPGAAPRSPLGRFGHRELPGQVKADKATEAGKPRRIQVSASHPVRRTKIRYSIRMLTSLQSCSSATITTAILPGQPAMPRFGTPSTSPPK